MRLSVIAIGGTHQLIHFIPLVLKLAQRGLIATNIFVANSAQGEDLAVMAKAFGLPVPPVTVLKLPALLGPLRRSKLLKVLFWRRRLRDADAMLSAERTSTILARLPGHRPPFLHIPHGAGDRAKGFEPRIRLFDRVLVSGEKDRERIVAAGLLPHEAVEAIGSVKLATLSQTPPPDRLFANNLPTILYNPHFSKELGTFDLVADRLIGEVERDSRYNLILAPHVRLAERMKRHLRGWQSRGSERIIVDMGSHRSIDMTYTRSADIYLGDVSSQVYEMLSIAPRPCLFVNRGTTAWSDNPDFAMWHLGPVIAADAAVLPAIDDAVASFEAYRERQADAVARAYAHVGKGALDRMAERMEEIMLELAPNGLSARSRSRYR